MNEKPVCALCHSNENVLVQTGVRHAPQIQVRRCHRCGLEFLWPRSTADNLANYYTEDYRVDYGDLSANEQRKLDLDEARLRVRRILPYLSEKTRLLEIGSGSGAFLDSVRPYCGNVTGVEPHEEYRKAMVAELKIKVVAGIDELLKSSVKFDVVTMFHVLEHIEDPVAFLKKVARVMSGDSALMIEVPNIDDVLVKVYKIPQYLSFYYQKAHLYYFSKRTLSRIYKEAGFSATIEGVQRYDISNHIRWMLTGKPRGQGYYRNMFLPSTDAAYADALIRAGCQDTLWSIARPKTK